jgi:hypothetical protein
MLVTFILIQLAVNVALAAGVFRLLQRHEAISGEARRREERLETLAADLCSFGREVTRRSATVSGSAPAPDPAPRAVRVADRVSPASSVKPTAAAAPTDRFRGAVTLHQQGVGLEKVAAETTLLEGEIQVLRNLARGSRSTPTVHRGGRPGRPAGTETTGAGRRRAGGARLETKRLGGSAKPASAAKAGGRDTQSVEGVG